MENIYRHSRLGNLVTGAILFTFIGSVSGRTPSRRCNYIPAEGCSCLSRFGRLTISCVNLGLTEVPDLDVIPDGSQVVLDLSNNKIALIPSRVFDSIQLIKLIIENNRHSDEMAISDDIFERQVNSLQTLDFANSSLSTFPLAVSVASDLMILDLSSNNIQHIPECKLTHLKRLYLDGNPIRDIESSTFADMRHLRDLSITIKQLSAGESLRMFIPCDSLSSLTSLAIVNTDVGAHLKDVVSHNCLSRLHTLECDTCQLTDDSLGIITSQTAHNFVSIALPHNYLGNNAIKNLVRSEESISALPSLRHLDLSNNAISSVTLPDSDRFFPPLVSLDLSHNRITKVDSSIYSLPSLSNLDLSHNSLTMVDLGSVDWDSNYLKVLLEGNPLVCDCEAEWMINTANDQLQGAPGPLHTHEIHTLTCHNPTSLRGVSLYNIRLNGLCCTLLENLQSSVLCDVMSSPTMKEACLQHNLNAINTHRQCVLTKHN